MNKDFLKINKSIIKITGIFEFDGITGVEKLFKSNGFNKEILKPDSIQFHKNYWYPEFRDIFFMKADKSTSATILNKTVNKQVHFIKRKSKESNEITQKLEATISEVEIFLFPNGLHFFSVSFLTENLNLSDLSNLTNFARNFETEIQGTQENKWVNWVENEVLNGIKIYSNWDEKPIPVDEYSGSKFKLFTVVDIEPHPEFNQQMIDELLYDLGCVAPIGTAGGNMNLTPSEAYYNLLLEDKISAFNNFSMLPLFDTFTTVGTGIISMEYQQATYQQTYYRIYLFNLFIKYNLYKYNNEMRLDTMKTRDKFESFLNNYNFQPISYNFLPNLIFEKHRKSLQIDEELKKFEERINKISQTIQEDQQKRMNLLLGIVGLVTSISSIEPVFGFLENIRTTMKLTTTTYYFFISFILICLALPILAYLFPDKKKKLLKKWKKK